MRKSFHLSTKLILNNSDIDEAFGSIHQTFTTKIKILLAKIGLFRQF